MASLGTAGIGKPMAGPHIKFKFHVNRKSAGIIGK